MYTLIRSFNMLFILRKMLQYLLVLGPQAHLAQVIFYIICLVPSTFGLRKLLLVRDFYKIFLDILTKSTKSSKDND